MSSALPASSFPVCVYEGTQPKGNFGPSRYASLVAGLILFYLEQRWFSRACAFPLFCVIPLEIWTWPSTRKNVKQFLHWWRTKRTSLSQSEGRGTFITMVNPVSFLLQIQRKNGLNNYQQEQLSHQLLNNYSNLIYSRNWGLFMEFSDGKKRKSKVSTPLMKRPTSVTSEVDIFGSSIEKFLIAHFNAILSIINSSINCDLLKQHNYRSEK